MFVVTYSGPFGFIKPWTAVRDEKTYSQQFLTQSMLRGMEMKLFPETLSAGSSLQKIKRYKLTYMEMDLQQEVTQAKQPQLKKKLGIIDYNRAILTRGVLVEPVLKLAFDKAVEAEKAVQEHICLCRNEDILLPSEDVIEMNNEEFDALDGFELSFGEDEEAFLVGYNRFDENKPMYGKLTIAGNAIREKRYQ